MFTSAQRSSLTDLWHDMAMKSHDNHQFGMVATSWDFVADSPVAITYLSKAAFIRGEHPFSDASLQYDIDHGQNGPRRAAEILMRLTDPDDRQRAEAHAHYLMNRGIAARYSDGVWSAVQDVLHDRPFWRAEEDRIRDENPELRDAENQALYAQALKDGVL
jgi:hypothetical protein